ncbi:MAG: ATP-binding protein, partial [Bdellovibrionota bacterium]
ERPNASDRTIRVNIETLDELGLLSGDLLVESARASLRAEEVQHFFERFSSLGEQLLAIEEALGLTAAEREPLSEIERGLQTLRDEAFRFVRMNNDGLTMLHGNLLQLADHIAEARLVPLATIFDAFPRAARELSIELHKDVELIVDNAKVGVDRSMIADLRDALVHLIRNAVDHGVEAPEARVQSGKSRKGRILLRARSDGNILTVEIEDDGRGIDPELIRTRAVEKQILSFAEAAAISDREALELIFRPGFSTRATVSDVSGRGVGMDAAKEKVENLGGSVTVQSEVGRWTRISLRLPQSLSLMRVLLFKMGVDVYGIAAADVEAVERFRAEDRLEIMGSIAVMYRGRAVTMAALGPLLGFNGGPASDRPPCIVVRHGEDRAVLIVDGFVDEREVAVKPIGGDFQKGAPFIGGSAALEDGRIAVLLHVPDIMAEVKKLRRTSIDARTSRRLRILLVDDSPIARATQTAAVRSLGHHVDEAQDGEDAWARLQSQDYDVLLTDV